MFRVWDEVEGFWVFMAFEFGVGGIFFSVVSVLLHLKSWLRFKPYCHEDLRWVDLCLVCECPI